MAWQRSSVDPAVNQNEVEHAGNAVTTTGPGREAGHGLHYLDTCARSNLVRSAGDLDDARPLREIAAGRR